jgi:rhomboid family GlyGly-CTERM serine protease
MITLICLVLSLLPESISESLQYQRHAISEGEWWRLISAHLVHLGWGHLVMNLLGMWLVWYLFVADSPPYWCARIFLPLVIGTSAGLWLFSPDLIWYRGLSGVLHGLISWALLRRRSSEPLLSNILLVGLAVKIGWEQWFGPMPGSESMANGHVIVASHLYGALTGVVVWLFNMINLKKENK